ncbi:hypothetical protein TraAM80_08972 [Trypanosoma rangeli]|uniref:Secreted protein n=1 Tax=Trypanosoma rangeli TaxID=5698 RepID=A0A3R7JX00_TRYRA|nr:uncharacterized protein TraAM80_08972 [Trypanosoma rangeli]RNE98167.1 hypothetical protein TraAM80_08972 [Trypanosoma rangeli]|eukprot:RNE98167.1 hypothetical protein TraAM80_08972 [Trypanosoma rangeli]
MPTTFVFAFLFVCFLVRAAFPHAQASFAEAKRQACARRRRRQGEQCSQYRPWELPGVGGAVRGVGARSNGATVWPPTGPPSHPTLFPALVSTPRLDAEKRKSNVACGMPFVEDVRVFASDWVTLTIQQRRKAPLCVVELPP